MSDERDHSDEHSDESDEQADGGHAHDDGPQGGEPRSGGQSAGEQPRGGTATAGQYDPEPGLLDKLMDEPISEYIKGTVILYAVVGAGFGLTGILVGLPDTSISSGVGGALASVGGLTLPVGGGAYIAALMAIGVGVRFAANINEEFKETAAAAAAAVYCGGIALWLISGLLTIIGLGGNANISGLIVLPLFGGVGVASVAAGTVYVERNFMPQ